MKLTPLKYLANTLFLYVMLFLICYTVSNAINGSNTGAFSAVTTTSLYLRYGLLVAIAFHALYLVFALFKQHVRDGGWRWFSVMLLSGALIITATVLTLMQRHHIEQADFMNQIQTQSNE